MHLEGTEKNKQDEVPVAAAPSDLEQRLLLNRQQREHLTTPTITSAMEEDIEATQFHDDANHEVIQTELVSLSPHGLPTGCPVAQLEGSNEQSSSSGDDDDDPTTGHDPAVLDGFRKTCRFVARIGWYACYYGATPSRVEVYLQDLMEHFGYTGSIFRVTNTELFCVFSRNEYDDDQIMRMLELKEGLHLHRLGLLNEVCKQLRQEHITQQQAWVALDNIAKHEPDPWNFPTVAISFVLTGTLAPAVFQGTWWDLLGGTLASLPVFALTIGLPADYQKALPLLSSFVATVVAIVLQRLWIDGLHVALVVMASVIIQVPGYGASLAVSEIITNHITAGIGRLVNALFTLCLLVGGYWVGVSLLDEWKVDKGESETSFVANSSESSLDAIPFLWQALLCAPVLMICLCFQFQISPNDCPWSFGNLMIAYGTSYAAAQVSGHNNIGVLLAAAAVTIYAHAWARWYDRPRSIVITPALVLLVSGSIGFRGLVALTTEDGGAASLQQFAQMFVVALLILAGLLIGNLLLRAPTTL